MDNLSRSKDEVPARDAALAETPRVMAEARDALTDLHGATVAMGVALVETGLPRRAWRSEQAALRLLSPVLPAITIDAYLARLEQFATRAGPTWLHGNYDDLAAFHEEVAILSNRARSLQEVVHRLQHEQVGPRSDHPLQRVVRHPRVQAPLETIAAILSDLEALSPFMQPLSPERWDALPRASGPLPAGVATLRFAFGASRAWLLQRLSWRRRPSAQRWLLVAGLLVTVAALAVLAASRLAPASGQEPSLTSFAALTALAGSGTALATGSPASSPPAGGTPGPAPKLALTCVLHGATATLSLKNVGAASFTWQAQPPPTLTVSPTQGVLEAGHSAAVQVSAQNKKSASGVITVMARHDSVSIEDKVACR